MSDAEARPCPWCGRGGAGSEGAYRDEQNVVCHGCGIRGPRGESEANALERWNTRPVEDGILKALRQLADTIESPASSFDRICLAVELARAAIKKAGGAR